MCLTAHENMNLIAVGFKDGTVILVRGNITRDRLSRIKVVHQESEVGAYVTGEQFLMWLLDKQGTVVHWICLAGLGFRQIGNQTYLMISTTGAVYSLRIGAVENVDRKVSAMGSY